MRRYFEKWARKCVKILALAGVIVVLVIAGAGELRAQEPESDLVNVIVELASPSAAEVYVAASANGVIAADAQALAAATAAQVMLVAAEQDAVAATLQDLGAVEIYRVQRAYNGIGVRVPVASLDQIAALPQVVAVHPLVSKEIDNSRGVPLIGAPQLWSAPFGLLGDGVSIGVIDTGADYLHVGLGGPGTGYLENDTTIVGDVVGFPNNRIVGGYDFAGDGYNSNPALFPYNPVPVPDPDPMDCYDHGTHVAATVGGNGVTDEGKAYTGPYSSATDFPDMRIGPGVAPRADIYALKVFGCFGSSEIVDLAIEWAIDPNGDGDFGDHLDVINLSLGSPVGNAQDYTAIAAERAAQLGIIVVASAGNTGDTFFVVGSPGTAQRVVTVGATIVDDNENNDTIASFSARGPRTGDNLLKPDISAPGVAIVSALNGSGSGASALNGTSMATPFVAGALALLRQQYPTWSVEEIKALVMNTATVVRTNVGGAAYTEDVSPPTRAGAGRVTLNEANDAAVLAFSADSPGGVSLSFGAPEIVGSSTLLRNLRIVNKGSVPASYYLEYIPVTDYPGVEIQLPAAPTTTIAAGVSTTIPVFLHADSSLMKNVPDPALSLTQAGTPRQWRAEEQGHVYLWESSGGFSAHLSSETAAPPKQSGDTGEVTLHYDPATRLLSYSFDSSNVPLADITRLVLERGLIGQTIASEVVDLYRLGVDPALTLPYTGSLTLDATDARLLASGYLMLTLATKDHVFSAAAGAIVADSPVLKVPLHAAPRAVATMHSITNTMAMSSALIANRTITLTGSALTGAQFPTDTQSIVGAFELHANSPRAGTNTPAHADIKFVGVTSDWAKVANKEDARLYFALTTWGEWSTLLQTQFVVRVDTNNDYVTDYRVFSTDAANLSLSRTLSDAFVTAVGNGETSATGTGDPVNVIPPNDRLTAVYQNDVVVLSVPARLLGLDAAHSAFNFSVETILRSPVPGEVGDRVPFMRYDMRRPGLAPSTLSAGMPWVGEEDGTTLAFAFHMVNYARSTARGALLIHPFNAAGMRSETLGVTYSWPYNVQLPIVTRTVIE